MHEEAAQICRSVLVPTLPMRQCVWVRSEVKVASVRLSLMPAFSWIAFAGLLVFVGVLMMQPESGVVHWVGVLAIALAAIVLGTTLRVSLRMTADGLHAHNHVRSSRWHWHDIASIRSGVTQTPMTRAIGFGQLVVCDTSGRDFRLAATTGLDPARLAELLNALDRFAHEHGFTVEVQRDMFPTLRSRSGRT
jgi:hypothetical protein